MSTTKKNPKNYQQHHLNYNPLHKPTAKIVSKPVAPSPLMTKNQKSTKTITQQNTKPVMNTSKVIYPSQYSTRKCNCHSKVGIWS